MKNVAILILAILTGYGCHRKAPPQEASENPPAHQPFALSGTQGGLDSEFLIVINNEHDWEHLWREMLVSNSQPNPPTLNFEDSVVAVAFQGIKGTGGYHVSITGVEEKNSIVIVYTEYVSPGEDCILTQATTMPFALLQIAKPKDNKSVVMEKTEKVEECGEE